MSRDRHLKDRIPKEKKTQTKFQDTQKQTAPEVQSTNLFGAFLSSFGNQQVARFLDGGMVQAKLDLSTPGDAYERQADSIAQQMVHMKPNAEPLKAKINTVQAKGGSSGSVPGTTEKGIKQLSGKGSSLSKPVREFFEPRLGVDLGNVKVHTGPKANTLARSVNARAFTYQNQIVFGKGQYQPGTTEGNKLIGHELVHTVQQGGGVQRQVDGVVQRDEDVPIGVKAAIALVETLPIKTFVPIPGMDFMANFIKGMFIGAIYKMSEQELADLWKIAKNTAKAIVSTEFMKAYLWGFLKGFFSDFILLYELPGMIEQLIDFIKNAVAKIAGISKEDVANFQDQLDEILAKVISGGKDYLLEMLDNLKKGKISDDMIEILKIFTNVPQAMGKEVGGALTGVMLKYFSKDPDELGKELGGVMGELSGMVVFQALIIAITAGAGSVWTAIRSAIQAVKGIIVGGVLKAIKMIAKVLSKIGHFIKSLAKGVKGIMKGLGNGAKKIFKGLKGKMDDVLERIGKLIDDILKKLGWKTFGVDPEMIADDIAKGVLKNGSYIKNPTAKKITEIITDTGKVGSKQMSGKFMYVVDESDNIIIGTRAGRGRMPHPTLVGGVDPQVKCAGMIDIRGGKIYSIDNISGHFKPSTAALNAAKKAFDVLPKKVFHKNFLGYIPY